LKDLIEDFQYTKTQLKLIEYSEEMLSPRNVESLKEFFRSENILRNLPYSKYEILGRPKERKPLSYYGITYKPSEPKDNAPIIFISAYKFLSLLDKTHPLQKIWRNDPFMKAEKIYSSLSFDKNFIESTNLEEVVFIGALLTSPLLEQLVEKQKVYDKSEDEKAFEKELKEQFPTLIMPPNSKPKRVPVENHLRMITRGIGLLFPEDITLKADEIFEKFLNIKDEDNNKILSGGAIKDYWNLINFINESQEDVIESSPIEWLMHLPTERNLIRDSVEIIRLSNKKKR